MTTPNEAPARPETWSELVDRYLAHASRNRRESTERSYRYVANRLDRFAKATGRPHPLRLEALTADLLDDVLRWESLQGHAPSTRDATLAHTLAVWRFGAKRGWLPPAPDIPKARHDLESPEAWTIEQVGTLLAACKTWPGRSPDGVPIGLVLDAMIRVAFNVGPRTVELVMLRSAWLDRQGWLKIGAEVRKQRRDHYVQLEPEALKACLRLKTHGRLDLLFGDFAPRSHTAQQRKRRFNEALRSLIARAGLKQPSQISGRDLGYRLRRSCASYLALQHGAAIAMQVLGHSSLSVTRRYLDPRIAGLCPATATMPSPLPAPLPVWM